MFHGLIERSSCKTKKSDLMRAKVNKIQLHLKANSCLFICIAKILILTIQSMASRETSPPVISSPLESCPREKETLLLHLRRRLSGGRPPADQRARVPESWANAADLQHRTICCLDPGLRLRRPTFSCCSSFSPLVLLLFVSIFIYSVVVCSFKSVCFCSLFCHLTFTFRHRKVNHNFFLFAFEHEVSLHSDLWQKYFVFFIICMCLLFFALLSDDAMFDLLQFWFIVFKKFHKIAN